MIINKICVLDENVDLALLVVILVAKLRVVRVDSIVWWRMVWCVAIPAIGRGSGQQQRRQKIAEQSATILRI
jgi:hypothetical protein